MAALQADACAAQRGRAVTREQLARRNAAIAEGQRRAWANPQIRARRSAAIARAQDDPLFRAVMSRIKLEGKTK
jgi:hypothetical protein